ncbi:MAG: hypothetical protein ACI83D_000427 [Planctomycetota bacterium]|jgi:hypothetical protein
MNFENNPQLHTRESSDTPIDEKRNNQEGVTVAETVNVYSERLQGGFEKMGFGAMRFFRRALLASMVIFSSAPALQAGVQTFSHFSHVSFDKTQERLVGVDRSGHSYYMPGLGSSEQSSEYKHTEHEEEGYVFPVSAYMSMDEARRERYFNSHVEGVLQHRKKEKGDLQKIHDAGYDAFRSDQDGEYAAYFTQLQQGYQMAYVILQDEIEEFKKDTQSIERIVQDNEDVSGLDSLIQAYFSVRDTHDDMPGMSTPLQDFAWVIDNLVYDGVILDKLEGYSLEEIRGSKEHQSSMRDMVQSTLEHWNTKYVKYQEQLEHLLEEENLVAETDQRAQEDFDSKYEEMLLQEERIVFLQQITYGDMDSLLENIKDTNRQIIQMHTSDTYISKLAIEFGISFEEAQKKAIDRATHTTNNTVFINFFTDNIESLGYFVYDKSDHDHGGDIHLNPYYTLQSMSGWSTHIHEAQHSITFGNRGISALADDIYAEGVVTPEEYHGLAEKYPSVMFCSYDYISNITELDARKKVLEFDMMRLGIKSYSETFTEDHYYELWDLFNQKQKAKEAGKEINTDKYLDINSEQILLMLSKSGLIEALNSIADVDMNKHKELFYNDLEKFSRLVPVALEASV